MAEQAGLQAGDQLLKVGDELVTGLAHEKIIELIKTMPVCACLMLSCLFFLAPAQPQRSGAGRALGVYIGGLTHFVYKHVQAPVRMTVRFHAQGYREFIAARKAVRGSIQRRVPQSDESMVRNTNSPGGSGPEGDDTVTINLVC